MPPQKKLRVTRKPRSNNRVQRGLDLSMQRLGLLAQIEAAQQIEHQLRASGVNPQKLIASLERAIVKIEKNPLYFNAADVF